MTSDAKATFRGFRGQTLYILSRIIDDSENFKYRPEGLEDLDICLVEDLKELIQVKFYTKNLQLYHLKPEKKNSFLRRSVEIFKSGLFPKIFLVSFGPVGPELKNGFDHDGSDRSRIKSKLKDNHYKADEIDLIFENIKIIKVNENEIAEKIINYLKSTHIGFDPDTSFNLLMNWVYLLSEKAEIIDKHNLVDRLNNIGIFYNQRYNFLEQYGLTVKTIKPSGKTKDYKKLQEEFYMGISARYEHILADLDVNRPNKMDEIKTKFGDNNVVIIRGASGQGKSTLAYRFLQEFYPEPLIYQITSKDRDALPIISTLHAISKSIDDNLAIYIDVEPGDTIWPKIVEELYRYPKFNVLVSIREEDWTRSTLSSADLILSEVELTLNKEEAEHIYDNLTLKKTDKQFLNFEDSWAKFGYEGPLLEFIYLITQGSTLKERLNEQINRIREDPNEQKRLEFLRIVSIIGMYGGKTDLKSIKSIIKLDNLAYVINLFQKEYLIRKSENGRFIETLHPIRSKILVDILSNPILTPIKDDIPNCLSVIHEKNLEVFILNCFLKYGSDERILESINFLKPKTWTGYGQIIKSLLWLGIKKYVDIAIKTDFNNSTLPVKFQKETQTYKSEKFVHEFLENWLNNTDLPLKLEFDMDFMYAGYSMFWISELEIEKEVDFSEIDFDKLFNSISLESISDFVLGLYYFRPNNPIIKHYRPKIIEKFKRELLVPLIDDDGEKIRLHCIINVTEADRSKNSENFAHELVMERITLIRRLYPEREIFASKGYGHQISFLNTNFDDTKKGIPIRNLPLNWLVELNSTYIGLIDYQDRPDSWEDYVQQVVKTRQDSLNVIEILLKNLKKYFKKRKQVNVLELNNLSSKLDNLIQNLDVILFPKCSVDPWGYTSEKNAPKFGSKISSDVNSIPSTNLKKFSIYRKIYMDFISSSINFFSQGKTVISYSTKKGNKNGDIKENTETQTKRLSIINLFRGYVNLVHFQKEFTDFFKKYASIENLVENELNNYGKLAEIWRIFVLNEFIINKQIMEEADNLIKNYKKEILMNLLKVLEKENLDVKFIPKFSDKVNEIYLIFDIQSALKIDETLLIIISTIHKEFQGTLPIDLKMIFLELNFPYFNIIILVKGKILLPASYNYPLYRAISAKNDKIDILDMNPKLLENKIEELNLENWSDFNPEIGEIQKLGMIIELKMLIYHIKQLSDLELDSLGFEITSDYINKISVYVNKDFQEVLNSLTFVTNKLRKDINTLKVSGEKISPEIKSELQRTLNVIKEANENIFPEKPKGNGKFEFNINLKSIDVWYESLEKSENYIYYLYYYYADQIISEFDGI